MIIRQDPDNPVGGPVEVDPEDVLATLNDRLGVGAARKGALRPYREGRMPLKGVRSDFLNNIQDSVERAQTQAFLDMSKLSLCDLIVDAITDDMGIDSFTDLTAPAELPDPDAADVGVGESPSLAPMGGDAITANEAVGEPAGADSGVSESRSRASGDELDGVGAPSRSEQEGGFPSASLEAQTRFRRQHGPSVLKKFASDTFHYGEGFLLVDDEGVIKYVPSDCAVVITDGIDPWERKSAAVKFTGADGAEYTQFWIKSDDGRVYSFQSSDDGVAPAGDSSGLTVFTRVPVIPATTPDGRGIYETHLPVIDRINFSIYERLVLMDKQAFRELWIKGLPAFYENPETGEREVIDWSKVILRGPGNANLLPGTDTDVEETGGGDFTQITAAVFNDVKYLAAVTSTPLYILDPSAAQESALGADKADKVHRTRIRTLRIPVGEAFAEAMSLSFEATGEAGKEFETVWSPLEDETLAQRAQAATVLQSIIPQRSLWTDVLQLTPEQISRAEAGLVEDRINKILDGVAEAKAEAQAQMIQSSGSDAGVEDGSGQTPAEEDSVELSSKLVSSLGPAGGNAIQISGDEDTFSKSRSGKGTGANTAAVFLIDYLQSHGGEAPAADIQAAAAAQGYGASTIKVARTRMKDRVLTVKRPSRRGTGKQVWWQLNTKDVHNN